MLDIGWSELMVIAVVAIVIVPSKDLPKLLRTVGQTVGRVRRMAGDFQSQFNSALREAEREVDLIDAKKQIQDLKSLNPVNQVKDALNPLKATGEEIRRSIEAPGPAAQPAPAPVAAGAGSDPLPDPGAPAPAPQATVAPSPSETPQPVAPPPAASEGTPR